MCFRHHRIHFQLGSKCTIRNQAWLKRCTRMFAKIDRYSMTWSMKRTLFCSTIKRNLVCICCYWLIIRKFWMHWYRHALFDFAQFFLQSYSNRSHFQSVRNFRRRRANHLSRVVKTDDKWKRQRSIGELGTTATSPKTRKMREK